MTAEGVDIDLYADDIEQDFVSDEFGGEGADLYDDVIANLSGRRDSDGGEGGLEISPSGLSSTPNNGSVKRSSINDHKEGRKHQVYIGNLTWWTSDKDLQEGLEDIGVNDFVEVKFFENRANGQSKGYCAVTVGSEMSVNLIHDKFPKKEVHGQFPVVTAPTKQALNHFESQVKPRPTPGNQGNQGQGNMNMNMMGPRGPPMGPQMGGMGMGYGPKGMMGPMGGGPRGPPPHRNMLPRQGSPGNYMGPQRHPIMGPGPQSLSPLRPPHGMVRMHHSPQAMPPRGPMHAPMMDSRGPPPLRGGPPPPQLMGGGPPPGAPAPHMNPAFFGPPGIHIHRPLQGGPPGPPPSGYAGGSPIARAQPTNNFPPPIEVREPPAPPMSETEFEEVVSRNRTVSSSAISRAVADAATGEFASAIETLVTAISLIKQSKVYGDGRCKILVSSLQDTLHGIESKSYGHGRRGRCRSHDRDRHRRSRRDRSRSREIDYRDRSRERYFEYPSEWSRSPRDREYRGRERDRYRELDSSRERDRERTSERDRSRERERKS